MESRNHGDRGSRDFSASQKKLWIRRADSLSGANEGCGQLVVEISS
jgi:hypothetical protein